MNVYIIDNYDSFTYNLYQDVGELLEIKKRRGDIHDFTITVKRNNEITLEDVRNAKPDRIIISPGPGRPEDKNYFGICESVIGTLGKEIATLGVCLGMQGIVHTFGGKIIKANIPMHGKTSIISHNGSGLFAGIPDDMEVMRYHSLIADHNQLPDSLEITATAGQLQTNGSPDDYEIMGIQHKQYPLFGIQFHPESFSTEGGKDLLENFLFML